MTPFAIVAIVLCALTVGTVLVGAWAARGERQRLERLARRWGVEVHDGLSNEALEAAINKRFFGWRTR